MARNKRGINNPYGKLPGREGRSANPDTRESPNPDTRESPNPDTRTSPDYNLQGGESLDVENLTPGESLDAETLTPPQSEVPAKEPEDEFVGPEDTRRIMEKAIIDSFYDRYKTENLTPEDFKKFEQMARQAVKAGKTPGHIIFQMDKNPELFGLEPREFHRSRGRSHMDMLREQAAAKAYEEMSQDPRFRGAPLRGVGDDPNAGFPTNVISSVLDKTGLVPKLTDEEQRERNQRFREAQLSRGEFQGYDQDRYPIRKSAYDFAAEKYPDLFPEGYEEEDRSVSGSKTLYLPNKLD
jgi:hypothetical protein